MGLKGSLLVGIMVTILTGCGIGPHLSTWDYRLGGFRYHGKVYQVTHAIIGTVGSKIGTISYHGMDSSIFNLYKVPGYPIRSEIAVRAQQGFLKAVPMKPRHH